MENKNQQMAQRIARAAAAQGGKVYYVGGLVRDRLLGRENKDIDIEVHGLHPHQLERILDRLGERTEMGASFGVYGLKHYDLDIAMPRKEKATGRGHRDFAVVTDPFLGTEKAARRRDFTINAMMEDLLTGEIVDHFGGREDLARGIIRHVDDETFPEDPLRVLRAAQFAARFGFSVAPETVALCRRMDLSALPRERVEGELCKALLKAEKPSVFFSVLREMDELEVWFPELQALIGVEQNPLHHPEGDAWNHTLQVLDAAAQYRFRAENPVGFMLAALAHDLGKAVCTQRGSGVPRAHLHEIRGLPLAGAFLNRLTGEKKLTAYVLNLVRLHPQPARAAAARPWPGATNALFDQAIDPEALLCLAAADQQGREKGLDLDFLRQRLELYRDWMARPCVMGKDLVAAGLRPGQDFKEILEYAHKLRLAGTDKSETLTRTLVYAKKISPIV